MSYRGHIEDGVVVLDEDVQLPNGTAVNVEPVMPVLTKPVEDEIPTLYDRLKPFVGAVQGLPHDLAKSDDRLVVMNEADWPTTAEGISALLKRINEREPLEMSDAEFSNWESERLAEKERQKEFTRQSWSQAETLR